MQATGPSRSSTWSRSSDSASGWASRPTATSARGGVGRGATPTRAEPSSEAPSRRRSAWENPSVTVSQTTPLERSFHERMDAFERTQLSPLAARSYPARRAVAEDDSPLRTPFQRDRDRIVHSKAFRRLKHKTQVFISPQHDHYRTRLTHTLEALG